MAKSYFAILGVSSNATKEEIRSAFRRLAKEFHLDHFRSGSGPFREIQEAYAVIGDPQRRHRYQQSLESSRSIRRPPRPPVSPELEPLVPEQRPLELSEISLVRSFQRFTPSFDEVLDWLWENFSSLDWPKSGRVQDLTLEVPLTPEQALRGGNARMMVPARAVCPVCRGHGGLGTYECTPAAQEKVPFPGKCRSRFRIRPA